MTGFPGPGSLGALNPQRELGPNSPGAFEPPASNAALAPRGKVAIDHRVRSHGPQAQPQPT